MNSRDQAQVYARCDELLRVGAAFDALAELGALIKTTSKKSECEARRRLEREIRERVDPAVVASARSEAEKTFQRAMRILSIGTRFNSDELLLILTLRASLSMFLEVLAVVEPGGDLLEFSALDDSMCEVAQARPNRAPFLSAIATMRRNCGVSFDDIWSKTPSRSNG